MPTAASNVALSASSWPNAAYSTDSPTAQLSGACALLAVLVQTQTSSQSGAQTDIQVNAQHLDALKQQLADAVEKAREASEHSGFLGFLSDVFGSDIAEVAGAVAAAAAVVASGGTAAPLVMVAVAEGLQLGAKAGAELGLDPRLCMLLSLASVAVGLCTGTGEAQAATKLAQAARDFELVAKVVQGTATATGGALHYDAAGYQSDVLHDQADVVGIRAHQDNTNLDLDDALSRLQNVLKTTQRETDTVSQIVQNDADTNVALSDRI